MTGPAVIRESLSRGLAEICSLWKVVTSNLFFFLQVVCSDSFFERLMTFRYLHAHVFQPLSLPFPWTQVPQPAYLRTVFRLNFCFSLLIIFLGICISGTSGIFFKLEDCCDDGVTFEENSTPCNAGKSFLVFKFGMFGWAAC